MKLTVYIETHQGSFDFTHGIAPAEERAAAEANAAHFIPHNYYGGNRPPSELEEAAAELQRITNAVAAMGSTTVKVDPTTITIDPKSIEKAASTAVDAHIRALAARSKAGKAAAAANREASR